MNNHTIRSEGCEAISNTEMYSKYITKNNTQYYTLFMPIKICYGNLYE